MTTPLQLSPQQIARYRATAQERRLQLQDEMTLRREMGWQAARQAANLLREQFQVERVVVFGSLVHQTVFTRWSDVDIAAWGLSVEDTFRAIGAVMDLETTIPVNLVDINTAQPSLKQAIERDGLDI